MDKDEYLEVIKEIARDDLYTIGNMPKAMLPYVIKALAVVMVRLLDKEKKEEKTDV